MLVLAFEIMDELKRAEDRFPAMHSQHEGVAIIEEEFLELREAVFWGKKGTPREEAIQLAAMAIRFIKDTCDAGAS